MKRFLSVFLVLVMVLSMASVTAMADSTSEHEPVRDPAMALDEVCTPGDVGAEKSAVRNEDGTVTVTLKVKGKDVTNSVQQAADVVLVVDNSGSMDKANRMEAAQEVGKLFAKDILGSAGNRMAVIGFAGEEGGADDPSAIKVVQELTSEIGSVNAAIDRMRAKGGTNYSAALAQAEAILNEREDLSGTGYVIFLSDGAPGRRGDASEDEDWNGQREAQALKNAGVYLYTIGISLGSEASAYMEQLASDSEHYVNVTGTDYQAQLEEVL